MELNRTRRWFYGLTLLWVILLLSLGSWWLYLVFKLHNELGQQNRFVNMLRWEGSFFFFLLVMLGGSLFVMYFRDMRKSKAMQAFFASLSHELKTPLASMRLQAEVIKDLIADENHSHEQLINLTGRLVEDTHKLEGELEKSLQLSRIEQDGTLTLVPVSLERYLKRHQAKTTLKLELALKDDAKAILADELALNVIFRNLFENTIRHNPTSDRVLISAIRSGSTVELVYDDFGTKFEGSESRLGELFYKFNSAKGTGIGLYLIKQLMRKMSGTLRIDNSERLKFHFCFRAADDV